MWGADWCGWCWDVFGNGDAVGVGVAIVILGVVAVVDLDVWCSYRVVWGVRLVVWRELILGLACLSRPLRPRLVCGPGTHVASGGFRAAFWHGCRYSEVAPGFLITRSLISRYILYVQKIIGNMSARFLYILAL